MAIIQQRIGIKMSMRASASNNIIMLHIVHTIVHG
jgi:hypothetical protein